MARYRAPSPDAVAGRRRPDATGARLFMRITREEFGWAVLAAVPLGVGFAFARSPAWAIAVPWCVVLTSRSPSTRRSRLRVGTAPRGP